MVKEDDLEMENVMRIVRKDGSVAFRLRKKDARRIEHSKIVVPPEGCSGRALKKWLADERYNFVKDVEGGRSPMSSKTTIASYFDTIFVKKKRSSIREKTLSDYIAMFNRHIRNDIGGIPIGKLTKTDLIEYYARLDEEKGLGNASILAVHRILSATLNSAIEDDIITRNVAAGKGIAPRKKIPKGKAMTESEVYRMLECLENEPKFWRNLITLMLHTGCRRGEIAGLRWEDLDLMGGTIHIRHSLVYVPQKGPVLGEAKSEMSNRDIPLMDEDIGFLFDMYSENHTGFVFTFNADPEQPLFPDSITAYVNKFCKKYDLPHFTPHTLRRTMPTLMITRYKADPKTLQSLLGHSNISTTLGYYTAVSDEQRRRTIAQYADITKARPKGDADSDHTQTVVKPGASSDQT